MVILDAPIGASRLRDAALRGEFGAELSSASRAVFGQQGDGDVIAVPAVEARL